MNIVDPEKLAMMYDEKVKGDERAARQTLLDMIGDHGENAFAVCCAMAMVAKNAMQCGCGDPDCKPDETKMWVAQGVVDVETNELLTPDKMPPQVRFASDFIVAYANGDMIACTEVWNELIAPADPRILASGLAQLMHMTAPYAFSLAMQKRMGE